MPETTASNLMTTTSSAHTHAVVRVSGLSRIQESLGAESTELYLDEFENRLQELLRPVDKLIKVATDKFCLVLSGVSNKNHVELAAAKLVRLFETPVNIIDQTLFFKINAGFVLPTAKHSKPTDLMRIAETALRQGIDDSQEIVIQSADEVGAAAVDPTLLPRLKQAIERNDMTLFYQPKVDSVYGHLIGAEGLVRWLDSESKKIVPPRLFIDQIEESELIVPLTLNLVKLGISRCAKWASPLGIAINVAPTVAVDSQLNQTVVDALSLYSLDPERLTLEITERGSIAESCFPALEELRQMGVKISIDDFGTGNCSLSYFRDLPADQIKIDQSFVQSMRTSPKDRAIVKACIEMAHGCGLKVVAEGVEDQQTADALRDMKCDVLQGYWFGKPLPESEFEVQHLDRLLAHDQKPDYSAEFE